jgi:type III secretion protein N (ATPase)
MNTASVGTIVAVRGGLVQARMPALCIGAGVRIASRAGRLVPARIIAADAGRLTLAPLAGVDGIAVGDRVAADPTALEVPLGCALLGRALDAFGRPLDGRAPPQGRCRGSADDGPAPNDRIAIDTPFTTSVRALDGPLAFGVGARIGIFGAPGCGKSTLLEMLVAGSAADATVVALVGERGREAERWITRTDRCTTVVCATSDRSAAERLRAAEVAFAQAEVLRRRGLHVLLLVDSLARVAAAARDLAVAAGEPVGRGGYPPSVFGVVARLLERAGRFATGSITLVATVLSEGSDERDPVGEACRAALDGHVTLSERLSRQGWFPAIDLTASTSRTLPEVAANGQLAAARVLRRAVAILDETREARGFGLDPGTGDPAVRRAIDAEPAIGAFLRQSEPADPARTLTELGALADTITDGYFR